MFDKTLDVLIYINKLGEIKHCPCCGGESQFRPSSSITYHIICLSCGMSSKSIEIPCFWKKKYHYLYRMYFKCLKKWNTRKNFIQIGNSRVEIR